MEEENWHDKLNNTPISKFLSELLKQGIIDKWEKIDDKKYYIELK